MEVWKIIYNDYAISNLGNLKSLKYGKEKPIKLQKDSKGYLKANLLSNGKTIRCRIHRLVAMAFIPNFENKEQVNHINGIKDDNRLENLEWCTAKENTKHAFKNNLTNRKGVKNSHCKLKETDVIFIRQLPLPYSKLAEMFNVNRPAIHKIKTGITWKHI